MLFTAAQTIKLEKDQTKSTLKLKKSFVVIFTENLIFLLFNN
jgi:hypothetical protein